MKKQIAKRIAELIIILIVLSFLTFLLMYLAPGDPAEKRLSSQGVAVTKEVLQAEQERMGLLRPFMVRYGEWLGGILHGDWGVSFKDDMPVAPKLVSGLKNTTVLALSSLIISLIVSIPLGIASAVKKNNNFVLLNLYSASVNFIFKSNSFIFLLQNSKASFSFFLHSS